jgi:hypothetical protein
VGAGYILIDKNRVCNKTNTVMKIDFQKIVIGLLSSTSSVGDL